ncbi:hypothetical protein M7I_7206 [Glarea lozoyensis 74030]|uniref:Uncharacterized protein n=1 Tax=Glarea lozoyensis (strain ATCC 74030 / MF5533) TaxID=1104152 RepID=H0EWN4_GLAL7|nr:hypothetical protein M7I_7206 [Glarea lozoyensis 74030]
MSNFHQFPIILRTGLLTPRHLHAHMHNLLILLIIIHKTSPTFRLRRTTQSPPPPRPSTIPTKPPLALPPPKPLIITILTTLPILFTHRIKGNTHMITRLHNRLFAAHEPRVGREMSAPLLVSFQIANREIRVLGIRIVVFVRGERVEILFIGRGFLGFDVVVG